MRSLLAAGILVALRVPAPAQVRANLPRASAERFLEKHGKEWVVVPQAFTGAPGFVYGSTLATPVAPRTPEEFDRAARWVVDQNPELFGVSSGDLVHVRTHRLRLPGSGDKWFVRYRQTAGGVPVFHGTVTVLFRDVDRQVIALDSTAVPFADRVSPVPEVNALEVEAVARRTYEEAFAVAATAVEDVQLYVVGPGPYFGPDSPLAGPALAYEIVLSTPGFRDAGGHPVRGRVLVTADRSTTVLGVESLVRRFQEIQGSVRGHVNVGAEPNEPGNAEQPGLANLWVREGGPQGPVKAVTDAAGNFTIPEPGPLSLYFELAGDFLDVDNLAGPDASFTLLADDQGPADVVFNPSLSEETTAEVAAAYWLARLRAFVLGVDPSETALDFPITAEVNDSICCGASVSGTTITLFLSGCGCPNTAYQSVILHEAGHLASEAFNGAMTPAFGEGLADAWAQQVFHSSCIGLDLLGPGSGCLRDGEQVGKQKCVPDCTETCNGGQIFDEGEVIASALWKVRRNLSQSLGAGAGKAVADSLFVGWMQAFDDAVTCNVIADHWVCLDDDNAHLGDGTPHFAAIDGGFVEQGWPGVVLPDTSGTFVPFGTGCAGAGGRVPSLVGTGTPAAGNPVTLDVTNGLPGGLGLLFYSFTSGAFSYGGGACPLWLGPPLFRLATLPLDATGAVTLGGTLPAGFPSDVHTYFQFLGFDPAAPASLSASNGLDMHSD